MTTSTGPRMVIEAFNQAWQASELDTALALASDDAVFELHVSGDVVQHAGRWVGRGEIRKALVTARSNFEYLVYRPVIMSAIGDTVHQRVEYVGVHMDSGSQITMKFRQVFKVRDGRIVHCDEYHDAAMLEAYLKLLMSRASEAADVGTLVSSTRLGDA